MLKNWLLMQERGLNTVLKHTCQNNLYGKRTVGFFSLASHALRRPRRPTRFARVRLLRHALPISLLILRKKPTVLQSRETLVLTCGPATR